VVYQEPLDGPKRIFQDAMFDNLVVTWKMTGKVMGRPVEYSFKSELILNHQFLQLHLMDINNPPTYEAIVYRSGVDGAGVAHDAEWQLAPRPVCGDGLLKRFRVNPEVSVDWYSEQGITPQSYIVAACE